MAGCALVCWYKLMSEIYKDMIYIYTVAVIKVVQINYINIRVMWLISMHQLACACYCFAADITSSVGQCFQKAKQDWKMPAPYSNDLRWRMIFHRVFYSRIPIRKSLHSYLFLLKLYTVLIKRLSTLVM